MATTATTSETKDTQAPPNLGAQHQAALDAQEPLEPQTPADDTTETPAADASLTEKQKAAAKDTPPAEEDKSREQVAKEKALEKKHAENLAKAKEKPENSDLGYYLNTDGSKTITNAPVTKDMWDVGESFAEMILAFASGGADLEYWHMNQDFEARNNATIEDRYKDDPIFTSAKKKIDTADKDVDKIKKDSENIEVTDSTGELTLKQRQKSVITAVEKAVDGGHQDLLLSFWGAESNFGEALKSNTTAQGDFHFIQSTFSNITKNYGNEMVADMVQDGYAAEAAILQKLIDDNKVGANKTDHKEFLNLRNNPVIATYAAKYLTTEIANQNDLDLNNKDHHASVYFAYVNGTATLKVFKRLLDEDPTRDMKKALLNLTPEESGLKQSTINSIKRAVEANAAMFENNGQSTGAAILEKFGARITDHNKEFENIAP
jgi:hypothetical protein